MYCVRHVSVHCRRVLARRVTSGSQESVRAAISAYYQMEQYGFTTSLPSDPAFGEGIITAVAHTAFGDGNFTSEEKGWIKGHFLSLNYPEETIDRALNCTNSLTNLIQLMADPRLYKAKKMLIYDCFRVANVDGEYGSFTLVWVWYPTYVTVVYVTVVWL